MDELQKVAPSAEGVTLPELDYTEDQFYESSNKTVYAMNPIQLHIELKNRERQLLSALTEIERLKVIIGKGTNA